MTAGSKVIKITYKLSAQMLIVKKTCMSDRYCSVIYCLIVHCCQYKVYFYFLLVQERLTKQIATAVLDAIAPTGVGVVIEAR